uniref:Uncharacterized protein n=1 Tax=Salmonella sp. TaxID=599 RepID=A0A482ET28_SALSP|nr:hypothetical protein NNIBIDOC_00005 [Salmonella sp.]
MPDFLKTKDGRYGRFDGLSSKRSHALPDLIRKVKTRKRRQVHRIT